MRSLVSITASVFRRRLVRWAVSLVFLAIMVWQLGVWWNTPTLPTVTAFSMADSAAFRAEPDPAAQAVPFVTLNEQQIFTAGSYTYEFLPLSDEFGSGQFFDLGVYRDGRLLDDVYVYEWALADDTRLYPVNDSTWLMVYADAQLLVLYWLTDRGVFEEPLEVIDSEFLSYWPAVICGDGCSLNASSTLTQVGDTAYLYIDTYLNPTIGEWEAEVEQIITDFPEIRNLDAVLERVWWADTRVFRLDW